MALICGTFARWGPDRRSQTIACNKKRETKGCGDLEDAEFLDHHFDAGAVNYGSNVDEKSQEADLECDKDFPRRSPVHGVILIVRTVPVDNLAIASFFRIKLGAFNAIILDPLNCPHDQ